MDWFYNKTISLTVETSEKNAIGQCIKHYRKGEDIACDVQPIDEKGYKYTWGQDIKSNLQVYCDEILNVDDVVIYNNKVYKIEKKIPWDDYNIYAILEADIKVLE